MIGKLRAQALEALRQREAAGLKPRRRFMREATKSRRTLEQHRSRQEERAFDYATCQACGAFRVPMNGKLPPHRCGAEA